MKNLLVLYRKIPAATFLLASAIALFYSIADFTACNILQPGDGSQGSWEARTFLLGVASCQLLAVLALVRSRGEK